MIKGKPIWQTIMSLGIENVIKITLGAIASILVGRFLGPESYGKFNFVLSLVLVFSPLINLPMNEVIVKLVVEDKHEDSSLFEQGLQLRLLLGLFGVLLCIGYSWYSQKDLKVLYLVSLYAVFFFLKSFDLVEYFFIAKERVREIAYRRTLVFIGINILKFLFVFLKKDWTWFVYLSCLELLGVFALYIAKGVKESWFSFLTDKSIWKGYYYKEILSLTAPFFLIILFTILYSRVDHLMIWHFLGEKALGEYGVVVKWNEILNFIPLLLTSALLPRIVEERNSGSGNSLGLYFRLTFVVSILIVVFFFFFGELFIGVLYGKQYSMAPVLIKTFCFQIVLSFFYVVIVRYLLAFNKLLPAIFLYGLAFLFNFILNYFMIPKYSLHGAVYASIIAYFLSILICSIINRELRRGTVLYFKSLINPSF